MWWRPYCQSLMGVVDVGVLSISAALVKERLAKLREAEQRQDTHGSDDAVRQAYQSAAAVLAKFDPETLAAYPAMDRPAIAVAGFLDGAVPIDETDDKSQWRLRTGVRRSALKRLATREKMREARAANPEEGDDFVQAMLDRLIEGQEIDIHTLGRAELVALSIVQSWLDRILPDLPPEIELRRRLALVELLAPMEKLAGPHGEHFVGRKRELEALRDYVGVLPTSSVIGATRRFVESQWYSFRERPPLMIYGPGGVGKSTLVAKFILDHAADGTGLQLPFVYLNLDRPGLDVKRPLALLVEAVLQLGAQFPRIENEAKTLAEDLRSGLLREDVAEVTKSNVDASWYGNRFGALIEALPLKDAPVLLVLDTFEEAQFLGEDTVFTLWEFLEALQRDIPRLRLVISGRLPVPHVPMKGVPLLDLDKESGKTYLRRQFEALGAEDIDQGAIEDMVQAVGLNPLSLRLVAQLVAEVGVEALSTVETRRLFFFRARAERIQSILYERILEHLHNKDNELGDKLYKLAHPGLAVRRITPDVIQLVLAEPCGIPVEGEKEARRLWDALASEVALVDFDREDPEQALRHRTDVRRLMLPELAATHRETVQEIDRRAVEYYIKRSWEGAVMLAEEIYHRLRLGQDVESIDKRWDDKAAPYLQNALEELEARPRVYLASKLGVTPDPNLLKEADQDQWEAHAARQAHNYLSGTLQAPDKALKVLQERPYYSPGSPLYRLTAEALRALDRPEDAIEVARKGLESVSTAEVHHAQYAGELERLISVIEESQENLEGALASARHATDYAQLANDAIGIVQAKIAQARILRKMGDEDSEMRGELLSSVSAMLDASLWSRIRNRPAVLRELVAEMSASNLDVLKLGVETVGIELIDTEQRDDLVETLKLWDQGSRGGRGGEIVEALRVGMDSGEEERPDLWEELRVFVDKNAGRSLNDSLRQVLSTFEVDAPTQRGLAKQFQRGVDGAILQSVRKKI